MVPRVGERSPVLSAAAQGNSLGVYTWVPKAHYGEGQTWIEATFTITAVRAALAPFYRQKGICNASDQHTIFDCRGSGPGKNDHRRPPCTQFDDWVELSAVSNIRV